MLKRPSEIRVGNILCATGSFCYDGMGNHSSCELLEESGFRNSEQFEDSSSSRKTAESTGGSADGAAPYAAYKRYYPKDINKYRPANKFFRSTSLQLHFSEHGSPLAKKPRTTNDSFISLPLASTGQSQEQGTADLVGTASTSCLSPTEEEDTELVEEQSKLPGPITSAVLQTGLRAKVRSFSSWFLSDHSKREHDVRTISSSKSFGSVSRLKGSLKSLNKFSSLNFRKRKMAESITSDRISTGSLNSLSDGRTPWPIPWLEAVFLPEYPNKGPVTEKHFQIIGTIARGAFGKVYRVCLKAQPSAIFAMKVQNKSDVIGCDAIRQMKDEVSIHESLSQSTFIAHLYASWQSRTKLYTVLEYATGYGDLYELWRDKGPFNEEIVRIYAAEIVTALDYIHFHGIIYRDLKLENIVMDDNGHVQLVDFGLAKWLGVGDRTRTICGTLQYMAPEITTGEGYDHAVDYWSLGVVIYVLLTGCFPFASAKDHWSLNFEQPQMPDVFSPALKDLLTQLLCMDPNQRPQTLGYIQETDFFQPTDFNAIANKQIHPLDYISGMRHCNSCNTMTDLDLDNEELNLTGFDEQYQAFTHPEYFEDNILKVI